MEMQRQKQLEDSIEHSRQKLHVYEIKVQQLIALKQFKTNPTQLNLFLKYRYLKDQYLYLSEKVKYNSKGHNNDGTTTNTIKDLECIVQCSKRIYDIFCVNHQHLPEQHEKHIQEDLNTLTIDPIAIDNANIGDENINSTLPSEPEIESIICNFLSSEKVEVVDNNGNTKDPIKFTGIKQIYDNDNDNSSSSIAVKSIPELISLHRNLDNNTDNSSTPENSDDKSPPNKRRKISRTSQRIRLRDFPCDTLISNTKTGSVIKIIPATKIDNKKVFAMSLFKPYVYYSSLGSWTGKKYGKGYSIKNFMVRFPGALNRIPWNESRERILKNRTVNSITQENAVSIQ